MSVSIENNISMFINSFNINNDIGSVNADEISCDSEASVSPRLINNINQNIYTNIDLEISSIHEPQYLLYQKQSNSPKTNEESVGDCNICYKSLPIRSNHIFTVCGHLFCVKCLFNWNNQSATCPLCRKTLYENITSFNVVDNWEINRNNEHSLSPSNVTSDSNTNSDDLIHWTDDPYDGDLLMGHLSERESIQLYDFRIASLDIFRCKIYIDSLFSIMQFTGEFTYQFIPRNHYIYLNVGSEHLYEFVIRKNTLDDNIDEINFFGHIAEFNALYSENDDEEDYLLISVVHPRFIEDDLIYDQETNSIHYVSLILKFSSVRRIYTFCPVYTQ